MKFIQQNVNKRLSARLNPTVLFQNNYSSLTLRFLPRDLLGALWLQLTQVMTEVKDVKRCDVCQRPIIKNYSQGTRRDKKYCSDACKVKAYRDRKKGEVV